MKKSKTYETLKKNTHNKFGPLFFLCVQKKKKKTSSTANPPLILLSSQFCLFFFSLRFFFSPHIILFYNCRTHTDTHMIVLTKPFFFNKNNNNNKKRKTYFRHSTSFAFRSFHYFPLCQTPPSFSPNVLLPPKIQRHNDSFFPFNTMSFPFPPFFLLFPRVPSFPAPNKRNFLFFRFVRSFPARRVTRCPPARSR